jgi:multidrug resistance efflux pump
MPLFTITHHHYHHHHHTCGAEVSALASKLETIMADISKLTTDVNALAGAVSGVQSDLTGLRAQIATLTAQVAAGGSVSQADIDALDTTVATTITNLQNAIAPDAKPAPAASTGTTTGS